MWGGGLPPVRIALFSMHGDEKTSAMRADGYSCVWMLGALFVNVYLLHPIGYTVNCI